MAVEVQPSGLARLLDVDERPRVEGWSLRAALVRYGQPQPRRASTVVGLVRRIEAALHPHAALLKRDGPALWAALGRSEDHDAALEVTPAYVVGVLRAVEELDRLADALAAWAVHRAGEPPDDEVDAVTAAVALRLDRIGVPVEQRERPPGRGRG